MKKNSGEIQINKNSVELHMKNFLEIQSKKNSVEIQMKKNAQ